MMTLAQFLSETALHTWIVGQVWLWPVLEITHFIGLTLLIGGLLVVDLRVLGVSASTPLLATYRLLPLVLLGFGLNLISGVFFSVGDPFRYAANIGFQAKMVFVLLAGGNALYHHISITPLLIGLEEGARTPAVAKISAAVSLLAWSAVLLLGRLIPYVGTG